MIGLLHSEAFKLLTARSTLVIAAAMLLGTWVMAYIDASQAVGIAPDDPRLYSNVQIPADYNGFDMAGWGYVFVIALAAIWAASEYGRSGQIRATLGATPHRGRVFAVKAALCALVVGILAFLAMSGGVMITHYVARDGIDPLALNALVWQHLAALTYAWAMVALVSFALAALTRSAITSLAILLPVTIGVGDFLAGLTPAAKFLPTVAAESTYTYPLLGNFPRLLVGALVISLWGLLSALLAGIVFARRDGG